MRLAPWLIALCVYIVAAVVATWPVAADPTGTVFGNPGDATGNISVLRDRNDLGVGPLSNAVNPRENAPFGLELPGATSLPQVVIEGPAQLVAAVFDSPVLAFNLTVLSGLVLTAFACFALCRFITGNWWAAGIAGLAYGFNPWILERAHGHMHFTHLWSLPLIVLGLLLIRRGAGPRGWALFAAALIAACYTNTYVSLFAATILGAFIVADLGAALIRRTGGAVRAAVGRAAFIVAALIAVMLPQAIVSFTQADRIEGLLAGTRSPLDAITYGSRWWEWIVPSYRHPVFSEWTAPYLASRQHGSNFGETALYVGWVMIAFAIVGVIVTAIALRRHRPAWTGCFAIVLVVAGLLVSLPKEIHPFGVTIPMPAAILSSVVEPWRVFARLFAVVMLGVAILAAIGLARALRPLPTLAVPAVATALAALVAFDLAIESTSFPARAPEVYRVLGEQPDDAPRVEYPLVTPIHAPHLSYIFYTDAARRPLMNGGREGTPGAAYAGRLADPESPWTAAGLASLGVRWAIVHDHLYPPGEAPEPGPGFTRVGRYGTSTLYRVTADPAPVVAVPGDGFGQPEVRTGGRASQWLQKRTGAIALRNITGVARRVALRLNVGSFARPRTVTIAQGRRRLGSWRIGAGVRTLAITATVPPGDSDLEVTTDVGLDSVGRILGNDDRRTVSISMSGIAVSTAGAEPIRLG